MFSYRKRKVLVSLLICAVLILSSSLTVFAESGDVAGAVQSTWDAAKAGRK